MEAVLRTAVRVVMGAGASVWPVWASLGVIPGGAGAGLIVATTDPLVGRWQGQSVAPERGGGRPACDDRDLAAAPREVDTEERPDGARADDADLHDVGAPTCTTL